MINSLIDSEHGIASLLVSLVVVLALTLLLNIGKFVFSLVKKKEQNTDAQITKIDLTLTQLDGAVRELRVQIGLLERELIEVHKFKSDSQKLFSAIKLMAGKRWPEIRKAMEEDSLPK